MANVSIVAITVPSSDFESRNRFSKRRSVGTSRAVVPFLRRRIRGSGSQLSVAV